MVIHPTEILDPTSFSIERAAQLLVQGRLVSFPTETVYGLGADATNESAVKAIYAAKGRPSFNPLIAHVSSVEMAKDYVEWSKAADVLASAFWPGPLTLVLPLKPNNAIAPTVTAGLDTLAIRLPAHPLAQQVLEHAGRPIAAPSANPSGRISPTTAEHVFDGLNGKVDVILDGGPCAVGLESTIVGLAPTATVLRPGSITESDLETILGYPMTHYKDGSHISAPGQMLSHYAPNAEVRLNASTFSQDELTLGFGAMECDLNLSEGGDLDEAARNLFSMLRQLDKNGQGTIAVAPIPNHGIGVAINDRLKRAAAPKD